MGRDECIARGSSRPVSAERLIQAAQKGAVDAVEAMLDSGADPGMRSSRGGRTALHEAASFGNADVARLLIARGTDPSSRDDDGLTPLHCAALDLVGRAGAARLLVDAGVDLDAVDRNGATALHMMATFGHDEAIRTMLAAGADPTIRDAEGSVPRDLTADPGIIAELARYEERETLRDESAPTENSSRTAGCRRI